METGVAQILAGTLGVPHRAGAAEHGRYLPLPAPAAEPGGRARWRSADTRYRGRRRGSCAPRSWRSRVTFCSARRRRSTLRVGGIITEDGPSGLDLGELATAWRISGRMSCREEDSRGWLPRQASGRLDARSRAGCGVQLSCVEIDPETGLVRAVKHAVAHWCGPVVNALMVDGQIKGGVAQGLGAALTEELVYDCEGQLLTGSLAEYRVPMPVETPDITVHHVQAPETTAGGPPASYRRRRGRYGGCGGGAVMNAVNDALRTPAGPRFGQIPATPARVLGALDAAG